MLESISIGCCPQPGLRRQNPFPSHSLLDLKFISFLPAQIRTSFPLASCCVFFFPAVQIHILKAEKNADWWKFTVNIISVYKQGSNRIRRGDQTLWIHSKDIACKCPKIKPMKKYLLLGNNEDSPDQSGIIADKTSLVIQWRDTWARRLRKFQQREKKGKCKKA